MAILPIRGRNRRALPPHGGAEAGARRIGLLDETLALAPATIAAALSLTTPYPSVSVAPGSKVKFPVTV